MRSLHVITDRDRRGAQVHASDLVGGLRSSGHDAQLVALAPGLHGDLLDVPALAARRRDVRAMVRLRSMAAEFDVVVAHGSTTLPVCAVALARSTPFVYRQISDPLFWAATRSRRWRARTALRSAAHVIALSDTVGATFADHYGLSHSLVTTIPNAVPGDAWPAVTTEERQRARSELGLPDQENHVAFVGALVPEKGADLAIRAIAELEHAHLLMIGDGPQRHELDDLASRIAPGRVHLLGSLSEPRRAIAAADCITLPSRGGDSMPAALIEAGLCGLPAVSTAVGAIPEVVVDDLTGAIVCPAVDDIADGIRRVLAPNRFAQLQATAQQHCREHFTIDAVAPAWIELLERIGTQP